MRVAIWLSFAIFAAASAAAPTHAQNTQDEFRVYAAGVLNVAPYARPFSGFGIYLGQNAVITAAHSVSHWPLFSNPIISIAGREIPAKLIKTGSFPELDLALLVVADAALPASLRLRQNPVCKTTPPVGTTIVVVSLERTERSQIISTSAIEGRYRRYFGSLVNEPHDSGSGVFDPDRKCLLGIISAAVMKEYDYRTVPAMPHIGLQGDKSAGYFVPASVISNFIPAHLRF
jgi:hypothetical protein